MNQVVTLELIYQAIKLTLNYYYRITKLDRGSFVVAALHEQKKLNLPWYKNIESLLKIDEIYNEDHVTAFNATRANVNARIPVKFDFKPESATLLNDLSSLTSMIPLPSRKFRNYKIMKNLSDHFKNCWE